MNRIDLTNRVAIVTGGAQGIGRAITERFLADGATVAIWDQDEAAVGAVGSPGASGQVLDITNYEAVDAAFRQVMAAQGRVDILVNNAGISGPTVRLEDYDLMAWKRIVEVDLIGVFHCCRAVAPAMREAGYGRIVNMASLAGKEGTPNASAYSAAKAGVIALTKSLGKELAGSGVLVNCIAPAAVETAILEQMTEAHVATMLAKSPLGRFGTVEEVAAMAAWLASEESSFNTGAVFDLSGGRATY